MSKFRKKPVVIEAFQLTYGVAIGKETIPQWAKEANSNGALKIRVTEKIENSQSATILTLEGPMNASAKDWIIKGVNDEIYPCKPDIFEKTYEPVE